MTVISHWADEAFFDVPLRRSATSALRVLYVGRMDSEKFTQCLRVCRSMAADGVIALTTVGSGPLAGEVEGRGMYHRGYIADKHELAAQFANADVVWGAADVTYVTLPGIEALAAGCPVIISDVPAVFTHADGHPGATDDHSFRGRHRSGRQPRRRGSRASASLGNRGRLTGDEACMSRIRAS